MKRVRKTDEAKGERTCRTVIVPVSSTNCCGDGIAAILRQALEARKKTATKPL